MAITLTRKEKVEPKLNKGELRLGSYILTTAQQTQSRFAMLLWGDQNVGKTCLAATAPGKKLFIMLDPEGGTSIAHREDVLIMDLSGVSNDELFKQLQNDNPLGLDAFLYDHPEVETVVLDSATALAWKALEKAVNEKIGAGKGFTPTIMAPGISAYGGRNNVVIQCLSGLLKVTAKHNRHCIITTHEDDPKIEEKTGIVLEVSMMLGGKTVKNFAWRLSEIWYMSLRPGKDRARQVAVRPTRLRKPMKTRIFSGLGAAEFTLRYDAEKPDKGQEHTLANFYERWVRGGKKKLTVPSGEKEND